jgi:hypothetical protein
MPGVDSRPGTPWEISLLSGIEVGLHYCDMHYETHCISQLKKGENSMELPNIKLPLKFTLRLTSLSGNAEGKASPTTWVLSEG